MIHHRQPSETLQNNFPTNFRSTRIAFSLVYIQLPFHKACLNIFLHLTSIVMDFDATFFASIVTWTDSADHGYEFAPFKVIVSWKLFMTREIRKFSSPSSDANIWHWTVACGNFLYEFCNFIVSYFACKSIKLRKITGEE